MSASAVPVSPFRGYRFPLEIISHAVWLYHRFSLSHRDVEELLVERGKLGPLLVSEAPWTRPARCRALPASCAPRGGWR